MNKNIFFYWEGPVPPLISVLKKLILLHSNQNKNYNPVFLNDSNIESYIKVPHHYKKMSYTHRADFIRVAVINKFGGIYIDSDTLIMSSMESLFKTFEEKEGFFVRTIEGHICNGFFGSKKVEFTSFSP